MTKSITTDQPDLSVVIVSYNTSDLTIKCIDSLFHNANDLVLDIIVVDNDSSDDSVLKIKTLHPNVNLIACAQNHGFAKANNIGFKQCKADYVLLLNPDTEVRPHCLQASLKQIKKDSSIGALGCRVMFESGEQQSTIFRLLNLRQLFYAIFLNNKIRRRYTWFGDARYANHSRMKIQNVQAIAGCFMLIPYRVIESTGGMSEYFFMYGEEAEWCYRIKQLGFIIQYFPDAEIMHHGAASSEHLTEWKIIEMARGHLTFLLLTRGKMVAQAGNIFMLVATVPRFIYFLFLMLKKGYRQARIDYPIISKIKFHLTVLFGIRSQLQHSAALK